MPNHRREKQSNQAEETRTDLHAQQVSDNADQIRNLNIKYLAGDSFYAKNKFISNYTKKVCILSEKVLTFGPYGNTEGIFRKRQTQKI